MANLSRRLFLGAGAAAALPVAAVSTAALITKTAQAEPLAKPSSWQTTPRPRRAQADALCPAVPPELVVDEDMDHWYCGQGEIDIEDRPIYQINERQRVTATVNCLTIDVEDYGPRTKIGKKARRMLKVAKAYEDARDDAKARSGLTAAIDAREAAAVAVDKLAGMIAEAKARLWTAF